MELSKENTERLKKIARVAVPAVLGTMIVKNVIGKNFVKHVSYWEASQSFLIDYIPDGAKSSIRLAGRVLHGPGGREDVQDYEISQSILLSEDEISTLEQKFTPDAQNSDENPLQSP